MPDSEATQVHQSEFQTPKPIVPEASIERYVKLLNEARAKIDLLQARALTDVVKRAEIVENCMHIEADLANVQLGLEHHLNNYRQRVECARWDTDEVG